MKDNSKKPIYTHTHLNPAMIDRVKPLLESAFKDSLSSESNPHRRAIMNDKLNFAAAQYANRLRISQIEGTSPLFEDAKIFGNKALFENASLPGNIIGMGDFANPASSTPGNSTWNPGYKTGSGDIPSYVFGLQSQLAFHTIGFELIPTIAVDTPVVRIQYVDDVYGGGTFNDADNMPTFIDINWIGFTAKNIKAKGFKRGSSSIVITDTKGKKYVKAKFMVASMVNAGVTVLIEETGEADAKLSTDNVVEKVKSAINVNQVSVQDIIDLVNKSGGNIYVLGKTVEELEVPKNDANTIRLAYTSAIRNPIREASTNDASGKAMHRTQHEKGPKYKLNVISFDKQIEMVGFEFEADTTNIQIRDFAAQGINVIARLYNGVQNQLVQSIDDIIMQHLYNLGTQHALNALVSQKIDYSLYIAEPKKKHLKYADIDVRDFELKNMLGEDVVAEFDANSADGEGIANSMQSAAYENQITHAERLVSRILVVSEYMAQANRIGTPDFVVVGGEIAATIKKHASFTVRPTANTLSTGAELHYTGTLFDNISIYKNQKSNFKDPRILLGRRGNDTDPGAKFLAYDLASSRQTIAEGTMAEKIRVWSRFAITDIGFYPELNYFTFVAINEYNWS